MDGYGFEISYFRFQISKNGSPHQPSDALIGQWKKEGYNSIMSLGSTNFPEHNENEFMKRGYLLPDGCKDLVDAMKLKQQPLHVKSLPLMSPQMSEAMKQWGLLIPPPPIQGVLMIPEQTTASQLAAMVGKKPFHIIAELMKMGYFVTSNQQLGFETAAAIVRQYGYLAKRAVE